MTQKKDPLQEQNNSRTRVACCTIQIRLQIQKVPGMRQFDIDGLDPERQQELVKTSNNIMGFSFGVVSLFSLVFALQVLDKLNN